MAKKTKTLSKKPVAKASAKAKPSLRAKPSAKVGAKTKPASKKPVAPTRVAVAKPTPSKPQKPASVAKPSSSKSGEKKKAPETAVAKVAPPAPSKKSTPSKATVEVSAPAPSPQVAAAGTVIPKVAPSLMGRKSAVAARPAAEKKAKRRETPLVDRDGDIRAQWQALFDRSKEIEPIAYQMSANYEAKTPILHKTLGWGYVVSNVNNRLEVLFESGLKFLISNYKVG